MVTPTELVLSHLRALHLPGYGEDEQRLMTDTMLEYAPTHVFEWGTNVGSSARTFYEIAQKAGLACEIHTTEHPNPETHDHPGHRYGQYIVGVEVWMHRGDGLRRSLAEHALCGDPPRSLFFLDGDHSYDSVSRELEGVTSAVPTAAILVHDTRHPVEETGAAVADFLINGHHNYDVRWLDSQAGMARLWPRPS